jgi:hypothetical protein
MIQARYRDRLVASEFQAREAYVEISQPSKSAPLYSVQSASLRSSSVNKGSELFCVIDSSFRNSKCRMMMTQVTKVTHVFTSARAESKCCAQQA